MLTFHFTTPLTAKVGHIFETLQGKGTLRHFADITLYGIAEDRQATYSDWGEQDRFIINLKVATIQGNNVTPLILWDQAESGRIWDKVKEAIEAHLIKEVEPITA